jgi:hypothetical protein
MICHIETVAIIIAITHRMMLLMLLLLLRLWPIVIVAIYAVIRI